MSPLSQPPQYQLAFTLHGHSSDVRNIIAPNPDVPLLLSASRDGSAILWGPSTSGAGSGSSAHEWDAKMRVEELEKRFVSCTTLVRWQGEAFLLMGSASGLLTSFILPSMTSAPPALGSSSQQPYHTLIEHKQNLCCIDASKGGLIATGSWDKTVIVWKDFKKAIKIETHSQAIWAVKFVGEDRILTASADKKITLHAIDLTRGTSHQLQSYTGHTDCVRGLSLRPDGSGFWSCGNDSLINVYSFDRPDPLRSLSGHTSFVYSVTAFPDGSGAISSGEDGTLRVWSETELVQTIPHPSLSLWSSAVVTIPGESGVYIASSSSDSAIRFFTRSPAFAAPATEREAWDKEIAARKLDKSQVGDLKHSDLPGMEALGREGKKDGQVLMIKNGDSVEAYQWVASSSTWQQIGQVVDAIGSGRKQLYEGQEWDYVFDVDVSEGMPPLKLPYNASENPWTAAQRFLARNELPPGYAEQVVDFIQKNTQGVQLGSGAADSQAYVDPFTGSSRYTGASSSTPVQSFGGGDPLTGGSAYSTTPTPAQVVKGVLPVKKYLSFTKINVAAVKGKISQLNEEIKVVSPELALTSEDEKNLGEIYALLNAPSVALPDPDAKDGLERYDARALLSLVLRWPEAHRFPLIDLARALALVSPALGAYSSGPTALLAAANWDKPWEATKARETNTLLMLRTLVNLFHTANGRCTAAAAADEGVITQLRGAPSWAELGVRKVPLATVALNYSILAVGNAFPVAQAGALLDLILYILENETDDSETLYRASIAFGNLILSTSASGSLRVGEVQRGKELVAARAKALKEKRATDLATEVSSLGA